MRKIVTLLLSLLFVYADNFEISDVSDDIVTFECSGIDKFQSGYIIREISEYKVIIKSARVIDENGCKAKVIDSEILKQSALPSIDESVKVGDIISFNNFSDRALIVAPNLKIYESIKSLKSDKNFIHPDIFATYMKSEDKIIPKLKDFQFFCETLSIGVIYLSLADELFTVDCLSFGVLKRENLGSIPSEIIEPFYSRVELKGSMFNFESKIDYTSYYRELLKVH
jgi:hypothetical protein